MQRLKINKRVLSKEGREKLSMTAKKVQKERLESGYYEMIKAKGLNKHSPEGKKNHSIACKRGYTNRCPFTMVDGIKMEVEKMNRYNTHCGVITESEVEAISEH